MPEPFLTLALQRGAMRIAHILNAVCARDCLATVWMARRDVDPNLADQLAAAVSGLASLARGTAHLVRAEPVSQTIVEMNGSYLFVTSVSQGSLIAVLAGHHCDMGMVGYEMTMLATRVGHAITPAPRNGSWSWR